MISAQPRTTATICRYALLLAASAISLYPMLWVVTVAFKSQGEYTTDPMSFPTSFNLDNFSSVIGNERMRAYFWNSVLVVIVAVPALTVSSAAAGYALARLWGRAGNVVLVTFLLSEFIPLAVLVVPLFLTIAELGVGHGVVKLMFVYMTMLMGFAVLMFRSFFRSIPEEFREAARLDGASEFRVFTNIMLPLARSPMTLIAVIGFLVMWNEYFLAAVLINDDAHRTVPLGLTQFRGQYVTDWPKIAAALILSSIPTLVLYALFQTRIVSSFSRSTTRKVV